MKLKTKRKLLKYFPKWYFLINFFAFSVNMLFTIDSFLKRDPLGFLNLGAAIFILIIWSTELRGLLFGHHFKQKEIKQLKEIVEKTEDVLSKV